MEFVTANGHYVCLDQDTEESTDADDIEEVLESCKRILWSIRFLPAFSDAYTRLDVRLFGNDAVARKTLTWIHSLVHNVDSNDPSQFLEECKSYIQIKNNNEKSFGRRPKLRTRWDTLLRTGIMFAWIKTLQKRLGDIDEPVFTLRK